MTTENDDLDSSWDSLADELGVDATAPKPAEAVQAPVTKHHHQPPVKHAPKPEPEVFEEDDFGGGLEEAPKDEEFLEDSEGVEGEEGSGEETTEGVSEEGEGKKKRRRRRRRRKKGGANPETAAAPGEATDAEGDGDSDEFQAVDGGAAVEEEDSVEEGEAPGEMTDDDDENENLSAVDEEMNTASTGPRQEWKVMSWNELVGKLHRPN